MRTSPSGTSLYVSVDQHLITSLSPLASMYLVSDVRQRDSTFSEREGVSLVTAQLEVLEVWEAVEALVCALLTSRETL